MSEDREQDRTGGRKDASRPVTAAARRERRASARAGSSAPQQGAKPTGKPVERGAGRTKRAAGDGAAGAAAKGATEKKGRATPARQREERRPSIFARIVRFLREVVAELRKVIWPTRKQLITYTIVVLVFVALMVTFIFGLDIVFREAVFAVFA